MQRVNQQIEFDEVTLKDLVLMLRRRALLVLFVSLAFGIAAGVAAFLSPKWFDATATLSPVASPSGGLGSSSTSQLGGLAALAGISIGGSDSRKSESIAMLQSEALTERYIETNDLLPRLYLDDWDGVRKTWTTHTVPTFWKANQYFKKNIRTVATDLKTGLVTLTIKWKDPREAATWANGLVEMTNEYMRSKAILESEANITYLNNEAGKTNIVEARQAIYAILQSEINKAMLARGSKEYSFRVIDPAVPSEKASSPIKSLWIVIGAFVGFMLGAFGVLVHDSWK